MIFTPFRRRGTVALVALLALGACDRTGNLDLDVRSSIGNAFDTSSAVAQPVAPPPTPDARGVVSYPNYQVALARRGDTVQDVAARVGLPANEVARYNGLPLAVPLRRGEVVALPRRVAEPTTPTGSPNTGAGALGVGSISTRPLADRASAAITRAETGAASPGAEPRRHRVARGETAYSIARRYNVPAKALGQWNGLGDDLSVRQGQILMIPVALPSNTARSDVTAPGAGSVAPAPPSSVEPLPREEASPGPSEETPASPNLGAQTTSQSAGSARFALPVQGPIIRPFSKGKNDGIDISATPGTPVKAAEAGTVAAITRDTDQIPILVLRHAGNLLTVYAGVEGINVQKGQSVSRGQTVARIRDTDPPFLHFEVRDGFESVDPVDYLE